MHHNFWRGKGRVTALTFLSLLILSASIQAQAETVELTGLEIALLAEKFLDRMENVDGRHSWAAPCKFDDCKPSGIPLDQNPAWLALAYSGLYEATGNVSYLEKVRKSMADLQVVCPAWNWTCIWVGVQAAKAYDLTGDEAYLEYLKYINQEYIDQYDSSMLKGIGAREFILRQKYLGEEPALIWTIVDKTQSNIDNNERESPRGTGLKRNACWLQLARLEYLNVPDDKIVPAEWREKIPNVTNQYRHMYDHLVKKFFDEHDFSTYFNGVNPDFYAMTLMEIMPCMESLYALYNLTGDGKYLEDLEVLENHVLENRWDTPWNTKYNGDYGFMVQGCVQTRDGVSCYLNTKTLSSTSYLIYLFSKNKDKKYLIKKRLGKATYYGEPAEDPVYPTTTTLLLPPPIVPPRKDYVRLAVVLAFAFIVAVYYFKMKSKGRLK